MSVCRFQFGGGDDGREPPPENRACAGKSAKNEAPASNLLSFFDATLYEFGRHQSMRHTHIRRIGRERVWYYCVKGGPPELRP